MAKRSLRVSKSEASRSVPNVICGSEDACGGMWGRCYESSLRNETPRATVDSLLPPLKFRDL